jgi:adenine-specific DNA-methyltransferase
MVSLEYKGKKLVQNLHIGVEYHQLVPDKKKSLTETISLEDNLILHGDNLKALKALLPNYANKIKCIYIDPPYNTGNEGWKYNDNVNSPMMQEWLGKEVGTDDLTRHDKWLCMMTPRLKLLRELLTDDGVIFISIDDNEQHRLRMLMDEVFGDNFVSDLIWKGKSGAEDDAYYRTVHEYVLCFAKNKNYFDAGQREKTNEKFPKYDQVKKLFYKTQLARKWGSNSRREDRPNLYYSIPAPDGTQVFPKLSDGEDGCWRWSKNKMLSEIKMGNIEFLKDGNNWVCYEKIYKPTEEEGPSMKKFNTWLDDVGSTSTGTDEIKEIFGKPVFDHPKPTTLVKRLLVMANTKESDIILDSFAGSGTTAHAVLDLNKEDGGNRKFILVECEDYADSITAERVRRVINGVKVAKDEKLKQGLGGSFSFFELGDAIDLKGILSGKSLPSYQELARYVYYTATGEEFVEKRVDQKSSYIGESRNYEVYLIYKPDLAFLKTEALNTKFAEGLGLFKGKRRLVFAPANFLDASYLAKYSIDFCQLPYEIYRIKG